MDMCVAVFAIATHGVKFLLVVCAIDIHTPVMNYGGRIGYMQKVKQRIAVPGAEFRCLLKLMVFRGFGGGRSVYK